VDIKKSILKFTWNPQIVIRNPRMFCQIHRFSSKKISEDLQPQNLEKKTMRIVTKKNSLDLHLNSLDFHGFLGPSQPKNTWNPHLQFLRVGWKGGDHLPRKICTLNNVGPKKTYIRWVIIPTIVRFITNFLVL
jgi:hypothetical protein